MRGRIIHILALTICSSATAQDVFNSANIFIQADVTVTTEGSLSNLEFILNNGSITLTGDWLNTFIYQGLGTIAFTGSDQLINNNRQSIHTLSIRGGGVKTLNGSLYIDRLLTLEDGILTVSDQDTLRFRAEATVEGGSVSSYINGAMTSLGTGYRFFPIGKNGKYHPVELLNITGISPGIEVEVQESLPVVETSLPATPITDVYWTQKVVRGKYDGSPVTVHYNLREGIAADHVVILEGSSFTQEFQIRETKFQSGNELDIIESVNSLSDPIIALAELNSEPPREYYFSTTLSPNAQNPDNRVIRIFGDNVTTHDFHFQVFNRWGLLVYETTSADNMLNQGWDGSQNGNALPTGAYPYNLTYVNTTGKAVKKSGFITIVQ